MFYHETFPRNRITNHSVLVEYCRSIEVGWRKRFRIEHLLQITTEVNYFKKSSAEVLKWIGDNVS